ncbi:MAG: SseB family protein [Mycobacteriales bacterium]
MSSDRLARAVSAYDGSPAAHGELLAALVDAAVYAPITATSTAEHVEEGTGLRAESSAEMAVVLLAGPDGSRALPVFSSTATMKRWRPDVRPVLMSGREAAQAAAEQGAAALVVDEAVTVFELADLARGWVPVTGTGLASRMQEAVLTEARAVPAGLVSALRAALAPEGLRSARLLEGPDGLVLGVAPALDPAALAALAHRVVGRLGSALPPEGLDLTAVPRRGPGLELVRRRRPFPFH